MFEVFYGKRPLSLGAYESEGISSCLQMCERTYPNNCLALLPVFMHVLWTVHALIFQVFPCLYVPACFCQCAPAARDVKQPLFGAVSLTG